MYKRRMPARAQAHSKQVIGYITQYDGWKDIPRLVPKGGYNQLNVDFSQYTILNFSFFGLAKDGTLHSGDYRNKQIYLADQVQEPAPLLNEDVYSSFDLHILYGELDFIHYISLNSNAYNLGYRNVDEVKTSNAKTTGWVNINTCETGPFPLVLPTPDGRPGLLQMGKKQGVKVVASLGGWSMSKHFCEVAADDALRATLVRECANLITELEFDGVDFDWEYPNAKGMNIEHYSDKDYANFALLMEEVRDAIGRDKLITAAMSASPANLAGFDWGRLQASMDFFNIMTYDINGGWSEIAGHNSPLYVYPGQEGANPVSLDTTTKYLVSRRVAPEKINLGAAFYGRGVITEGSAALNARTVKKPVTVDPDGPLSSCGDFGTWPLWSATPLYSAILQTTAEGNVGEWAYHWDEDARVPYLTSGNRFLSYDNVRSIEEKAQYIKDQGLAGVIIWTVFGDMLNMTEEVHKVGNMLSYCPRTTSPLVNAINEVFNSDQSENIPPTINITQPENNTSYTHPAVVRIESNPQDKDGSITEVIYYADGNEIGTVKQAPYRLDWHVPAIGNYTLTAVAKDNKGATGHSPNVKISVVEEVIIDPTLHLDSPANNAHFTDGKIPFVATLNTTDAAQHNVVFMLDGKDVATVGPNTKRHYLRLNHQFHYSYNHPVAAGNYTCKAEVRLADGEVLVASTVSHVTVSDRGVVTVNITSPRDGTAFELTTPITITIEATDSKRNISKVELYRDDQQLLKTFTQPPYNYTWNTTTEGVYKLYAVATNNQGVQAISKEVMITVKKAGGGGCGGIPAWDSTKTYKIYNEEVSWKGQIYQQNFESTNADPEQNSAPWGEPWRPARSCPAGKKRS